VAEPEETEIVESIGRTSPPREVRPNAISAGDFLTYLLRDYRGPRTRAPLPEPSARSYVSNLATAERFLGRAIAAPDLRAPASLESAIRSAGAANGAPPSSISNIISAVRAYLGYLEVRHKG
jgi:hypothetical protein